MQQTTIKSDVFLFSPVYDTDNKEKEKGARPIFRLGLPMASHVKSSVNRIRYERTCIPKNKQTNLKCPFLRRAKVLSIGLKRHFYC